MQFCRISWHFLNKDAGSELFIRVSGSEVWGHVLDGFCGSRSTMNHSHLFTSLQISSHPITFSCAFSSRLFSSRINLFSLCFAVSRRHFGLGRKNSWSVRRLRAIALSSFEFYCQFGIGMHGSCISLPCDLMPTMVTTVRMVLGRAPSLLVTISDWNHQHSASSLHSLHWPLQLCGWGLKCGVLFSHSPSCLHWRAEISDIVNLFGTAIARLTRFRPPWNQAASQSFHMETVIPLGFPIA